MAPNCTAQRSLRSRGGYTATHPRQLGGVFCREISGATWAGWGWQGEKGAAGRSAGSDRRRCARRAPALRVAGSGAARGGAQHVAGEGCVGCVNFEWGEGEVW